MSSPRLQFIVESFLRGKPVDKFLARHLRNHSIYRIQRMIQAGCVSIAGQPADLQTRVKTGDPVDVVVSSPPDIVIRAEPLPLDILYEDSWIVVINKPAGQIAHPAGEFTRGSLVAACQFHFDKQTPRGMIRPGIVHRLDRQTSGLTVVTKEHISHRALTAQFTQRHIKKTYIALVEGCVELEQGWIHLPIGKVPNPECSLVCAKPIAVNAKQATTRYRVVERFDRHTLVAAYPTTGRHHQIRIHFAELGHPLVADEFYSANGFIKDGTPLRDPKQFSETELADEIRTIDPFYDVSLPIRRHALHAAALSFEHPIDRQQLQFEQPLPDDFKNTLACLRAEGKSAT